MSRLQRTCIALLCLAPLACTYSKPAATEGPSETPPVVAPSEAQEPVTETPTVTQTQEPTPPTQEGTTKGELLVQALPPGAVGLELVDGQLKLQAGYEYVEQPESKFMIRARDGQQVGLGGCGCSSLGDCKPVFSPEGIIVCKARGICIGSCRLAVTIGGASTDLIRY